MTAVATLRDDFLAGYADKVPALPGAELSWLRERRAAARAEFEAKGFPGVKDEAWKYTRTQVIEKNAFPLAVKSTFSGEMPVVANVDASKLVFVDGHFAPEQSDLHDLPTGVIFGSVADVLATQPEVFESHLAQIANAENQPFVALNTAFFADGFALIVPLNVAIVQPLQVVHVATQPNAATHARNIIVLSQNAEVTLIEQQLATIDAAAFVNSVTEVRLGENASLCHTLLQENGEKVLQIANIVVEQARNSRYRGQDVALGAQLARTDMLVELLGENADVNLSGLALGEGRQHLDTHLYLNHRVPHCVSHAHYRAVLDGRARGVFNGLVHVARDAQKTDSAMSSKNLLLSKHAEMDTKPELEIYADDVLCAHGATVGELDDNALFYLRSRGLSEQAGRDLLTYAFAAEALKEINHPGLENYILQRLAQRLDEDMIAEVSQ